MDQPAQMLLIKRSRSTTKAGRAAAGAVQTNLRHQRTQAAAAQFANHGKQSPHLPEGSPFGLVGSSSLYKRESYPNGVVPPGKVTATYAGGDDPWKGLDAFTSHGNGMPLNWHNQGTNARLV